MQRFCRPDLLFVMTLVLAFSAAPVRADLPDVLEHVPADAPVAVVAPSLAQVGQKLAMLNQRLGLNQPMLADPISFAQASLQMHEGVDLGRGAVFMMLSMPNPEQPGAEPDLGMLIPVTDYNAFLGNFEAQGAGDVREITLMGEPSYVTQVGRYALIGSSENAAANYESPGEDAALRTRLGAVGLEAMEGSDLMVLVDMEKLGPLMMQGMMQGMMMAPEFNEPEVAAVMQFYSTIMEKVMLDGSGMVLGLRVSEDGIALDSSVQFREDTAMAAAFAEGPAERPRLNHLPDSKYMVAATADLRTLPLEQWLTGLREMFAEGDDEFSTMMRQAITDSSIHHANTQMLFDPGFGMGGSLFNAVTVSLTDDPEAAVQAFRQEVVKMNDLELADEMTYQTDWQEDVMQIDGHDVDRYSIKMQVPPEMMAELGPAAMFVTQDMGGHIVTTDDAVIAGTGSDTKLLKDTLALDDGAASLDDNAGIEQVRQHLPSEPAAEMFINVGTMLEMANEFIMMFDPDSQLNVPANLPPVANATVIKEGGVGGRLFIPMPVIDTVRSMVEQLAGDSGLQLGATQP
ncbi:MAG: hypothetical protein WD294_10385 [Phycisphaeraceae bacterium]